MDHLGHLLLLQCPECHDPMSLHCQVSGSWDCCLVQLMSQDCLCDPGHAWEDVWEQAREMVFGEGSVD